MKPRKPSESEQWIAVIEAVAGLLAAAFAQKTPDPLKYVCLVDGVATHPARCPLCKSNTPHTQVELQ